MVAFEEASEPVAMPAVTAIEPGLERRVLRLAWPVIGENLLQTLLGIVDTLLVARLGAAAIAGVGIGFQLTFFLIAILAAVTIGASILVAFACGARQGETASRLARQALTWAVLISLPLSVVAVVFADPLVAAFGVTSEVATIGADYWRIIAGTSVFLIVMLAAGAVLRGSGDSRTPMLATLLANAINAVAAYVLIFGHFGFPALGPAGSAWAATLGRIAGAALLLFALYKGRDLLTIRGRDGWWPDLTVARRVFKLGIPAALEQILTSLSFVALTVVVAGLGTDALAAQRLTFTALSVGFIPGIGFMIAATALVGQALGAGRPAEAAATAGIATRWAAIWMGACGLIFAVIGEPVMRLFSDDPLVIEFGVQSFRVVALAMPFFAIMFTLGGVLRGAGNTTYPLWANTLGFWAAVGLGAIAVGPLQLGLPGLWGAYTVMAPAVALALWWRVRQGLPVAVPDAVARPPLPAPEL
ncbi:MAG: MATE family efflux transporter [Chloroflexi bacterium]|nr:MATE family efflux transporter [Chloroflexota bacterium]